MQNDESNNEHGVFSFQPEAKLFVRSIVDVFYITWLTHDIVSACLCLSVGGSLACTDQCTHTHTYVRTYNVASQNNDCRSAYVKQYSFAFAHAPLNLCIRTSGQRFIPLPKIPAIDPCI